MITRELEHHAVTWRRQLLMRETMFAFGVALIVFSLSVVVTPHPARFLVAGFAAAVVLFVTLVARLRIHRPAGIDASQLARHLDRLHPELEESSSLWLREPELLSAVEKLQLMRLDRAFTQLPQADRSPAAPPSGALRDAFRWVAAGSVIAILSLTWSFSRTMPSNVSTGSAGEPGTPPPSGAAIAPKAAVEPKIGSVGLVVTPPAYTRQPERHETTLNANLEEGSTVAWQLDIQGEVAEVSLRFGDGGRDVLPMRALGQGRFGATRVITESTLYSVFATLPDGSRWAPTDIFALKVIKDRPPTLRFIEPPLTRTEILSPEAGNPKKLPAVTVRVAGADDYGLAEAHLVATVAKGSGEAVKFREQVIEFDPLPNAPGEPATEREFTRTLDLAALGLEPGDELYFHVAARDDRRPTPNRARSETRFIVLKRPDGKANAAGFGVTGINLVPPYFRSQRQLIIDTEKLIADRPSLNEAEFRERSNELGIDQQLLRLRYGQFLGEELEEGAVPRAGAEPGAPMETNAAGIPLELTHQHDRAPAGADAAASREADVAPKAAAGVPLTPSQIIEPFVDQHDSQDQATYFDTTTKGSLRTVLAAMWEAEGFLRTSRPAEALPAENRALTILKALQQSARAYVQRVGFEAAPLKIKERRLQGDLTAVTRLESALESPPNPEAADEDVRTALRVISWGRTSGALPASEIETLRRVESRLGDAAIRDPTDALAGLQALRRLGAANADLSVELPALERALWKLLPPARALPSRADELSPELSRAYFQSLKSEEAKP